MTADCHVPDRCGISADGLLSYAAGITVLSRPYFEIHSKLNVYVFTFRGSNSAIFIIFCQYSKGPAVAESVSS